MYKVHQGATLLPTESGPADYEVGEKKIPSIFVSASKDSAGKIHISIVNAWPDRAAKLNLKIAGATPQKATARVLTAEAIDAHNTFDAPTAVGPTELRGVEIANGTATLTVPARSVTVLELQ